MTKDFLYPMRIIHGKIRQYINKCDLKKKYKEFFKNNPNSVFLLSTPSHRNIGDHAILEAEKDLLAQNNITHIEVTDYQLSDMRWAGQLDVFNGYPILIHGGGNLGSLWLDVEYLQRDILRNNPKSNIIMMPNTIYYENSTLGQKELRKSIKIYNHHKHLTIYARERTSYEFMNPIYRNVRLVPDIVLSLKKDEERFRRAGCLLCLRSDCEKTRTEEQEEIIRQQAKMLFSDIVSDTDMLSTINISAENREYVLKEKFSQFSSAKLVITDRLHGMIFCAITGTPCIVIDSKSPKVRGCYEWIKHLDYIRFADDVSDIEQEYNKIPKSEHIYDNAHLKPYYDKLAQDILNIL